MIKRREDGRGLYIEVGPVFLVINGWVYGFHFGFWRLIDIAIWEKND